MRVSILGGNGFLGRKLAARLAREGHLGGRAVEDLTLFDVNAPAPPDRAPFAVNTIAGDVVDLPPAAIPPGCRFTAIFMPAARSCWSYRPVATSSSLKR